MVFQKGQVSWNKGKTAKTCESIRICAEKRKGQKFTPEQIKRMSDAHKGNKPTQETRLKMSEAHSSEKHWNWQGGITDATHRLRQQMKNKNWRKKIFERDDYTCQTCGLESEPSSNKLDSHHIKNFKDYPELRYDMNNGQTLCKACHARLHYNLNKI